MYTLTYGEARHYDRAYVFTLRGRTIVYTGNVERMTKARKAAMHRHAVETINGKPLGAGITADALAEHWGRTAYCRRDGVTIRECVITAPDGTARHTLDYTYAMGSGSWERDAVTFYAID